MKCWKGDDSNITFAKSMLKETFGSKPNKQNIKKFFNNEVIKALWWTCEDEFIVKGSNYDTFFKSSTLRNFINKYKHNIAISGNIIAYFEDTEPAEPGFSIFPDN